MRKAALRVTIMLDIDISKKLRVIQSRRLTKSNKSISFSNVINAELKKQLK